MTHIPEGGMIGKTWLAMAHLGVGLLPGPTGTYGSALACLLFAVASALSPWGGWVVLAAAVILGTPACHKAAAFYGRKDPKEAVVDEVAGQALTLIFVPFSWPALSLGFFLFRAFDIIKPGPIRAAERLPGGFGIMADDLAGGLVSGAILRLVWWAWLAQDASRPLF